MADITLAWAVEATEPALLTGSTGGWQAEERWASPEALAAHHGHLPCSLGPDVNMTLAEYVHYAAACRADFPYYLFVRSFKGPMAALLEDYGVHAPFRDDLLQLIPASAMRYWICGPARTGTLLHVDPLGTAAWNTNLCGAKRWVFLPPDAPLHEVFGGEPPRVSSPCAWFADVYPRLIAAAEAGRITVKETVQGPGDTVYVPPGWHHAVLNLGWTTAITHNFLLADALPRHWDQLRLAHPSFAGVVLDTISVHRPAVRKRLPRVPLAPAKGLRGSCPQSSEDVWAALCEAFRRAEAEGSLRIGSKQGVRLSYQRHELLRRFASSSAAERGGYTPVEGDAPTAALVRALADYGVSLPAASWAGAPSSRPDPRVQGPEGSPSGPAGHRECDGTVDEPGGG